MSHDRGSRSARVCAVAAALTCVALLAGCGATTPKEKPPSQSGGSIEDQLGFTRKGIAAAQGKVENGIATCMKAQGFDYIPSDPVAVQAALTGKPNMSDTEFEAQFGYGISTLYGRGTPQSDPNARIRNGLSPVERTAYDKVLSDGKPDQTFFAAVDSGDFTGLGGCTKQATDEALGGTQLLATLQSKLDELDDSILADQRMVKAGQEWTRCMQDKTGETYEDAASIEDSLRKQLQKIVGPPLPPGQVAPDGSYDKAALTALQQREVSLSNTDVACEKQHITPVEDVVRKEKETQFKNDNADLLSKVKPLGT